MKYALVRFFLISVFLILMPGCGRLIDWGKETFHQGEQIALDTTIAKDNMRSVAVYDQFTTVGLFDALLLSDDVRMLYAEMHARKLGKNKDQYNAFLRRQLEENKHYLSFYVLSTYDKPLGEVTSDWVVFLKVNDRDITPFEVKVVDMPAEYHLLFGKRFNRFKVSYSVKFAMRDREDNPVIGPDTHKLSLIFRSLSKEAALVWDI